MPSLRRDEPIRILELRSVVGSGGGPEKTILLGTTRSDPSRYLVTVCYIRDSRDPVFHIDQRAQTLGVDYAEIVDADNFEPVTRIARPCYAVLAVFVGKTRLIDNLFIEPAAAGSDELLFHL